MLVLGALVTLLALMSGYMPDVLGTKLTADAKAGFFANALGVVATVLGLSIVGLLTTEQLDLERRDRAKDQRLTAKHAILMDAIRGINKMLAQIMALATVEKDQSEISTAFGEGYSEAAPAWAVAELSTVSGLQKLANKITQQFMWLSIERNPLVAMLDEWQGREKVLQAAHADNQRLFRLQTDATGIGNELDARRWSELFRFSVAQMPEMRKDRDEAQEKLDDARIPYLLKCAFISRRLRTGYLRVLADIRVEIDVDVSLAGVADFINAADPEDAVFVNYLKSIFLQHSELIDRLAREAGCRIDGSGDKIQ